MADPFSIVTGCVGLITAAGATTKAITSFIRDCRAARGDLTAVARELADLQLILELLKEDGQGDALPSPLQAQINRIVKRCNGIIKDIRDILGRCRAPSGVIAWAAGEKKEVEALRRELIAYREALSLNVETTTMLIAKSIKVDTEAIRDQTQFIPAIKENTEKILETIQCLRVSRQPEDDNVKPTNTILEDYFDGLTVYAESVCGKDVRKPSSGGKENKENKKISDSPAAEGTSNSNEKQDNERINDSPAAKRTSNSHEKKAAGFEEKESSPESPSVESKCHNCRSLIDDEAFKVRRCGHWLCIKCLQSKVEAGTQPPFARPTCCSKRIDWSRKNFSIDDKIKDKVNQVWGKVVVASIITRKRMHRLRQMQTNFLFMVQQGLA